MSVDLYKEWAMARLLKEGVTSIKTEHAHGAVEEVAYGMLFRHRGIISDEQLDAIVARAMARETSLSPRTLNNRRA